MTVRQLATGLAANRILSWLGFVLAPAKAARSWIGAVAGRPGGEVMVRAAHLASDATDLAATWAARRALGPARSAYALFMAGASTAIAAAYLTRSGSAPEPAQADQD